MPSSATNNLLPSKHRNDARHAPGNHVKEVIDLLAVMAAAEDRNALDKILSAPAWSLRKAQSLHAAIEQLNRKHPALVLCDREMEGGTWKDILEHLANMTAPPLLVVASRLADEHLWAEALNLGAYDVLATPFEPFEVERTLSLAWHRWQKQHASAPKHLCANGSF